MIRQVDHTEVPWATFQNAFITPTVADWRQEQPFAEAAASAIRHFKRHATLHASAQKFSSK